MGVAHQKLCHLTPITVPLAPLSPPEQEYIGIVGFYGYLRGSMGPFMLTID